MWKIAMRVALISAVCLVVLRNAAAAQAPAATNGIERSEFALDERERSYASEAGNAAPSHAIVSMALPSGFKPGKSWPVLVVISTSDFSRQNSDDIPFYLAPARSEEWIVLAGDAPARPRQDSTGWRFAMTLAAVRAMHAKFPGSEQWPVACAGYSGGAKRAGLIAPLLALGGCRVVGIFLTGINEDRLSSGYQQYLRGDLTFRTVPVFVSIGDRDAIATPAAQSGVMASLKRTGFSRVRSESFLGGHVVNQGQVRAALAWFRSLF
ncbi:MAG: hypothetical protein ACR2MF_05085 [Chthoniobacterales bacterium]